MPELVGSATLIASLHKDNKIRLWDSKDGRCTSASSSKLLPNYQFYSMISFQGQYLALSGDCTDILIIDSWSMEKLSFFSMSGRVLRVVSSASSIWAVDSNESLRKFEVSVTSPYYYSSDSLPTISNSAVIIYNVRESIEDLAVSEEYNVVAVKVKGGLRVFMMHWIEEDRKEYYHLDDSEILGIFCCQEIVIVKKNMMQVVELHDLHKAASGLREKFLSRSNSLTNIRVHNLKHMLKDEDFKSEGVFLFEITKDFIYGCKENTIFQYDRKDFYLRKFPFSFKQVPYDCFADMNLHYILADGEVITCSLTFLTADWPVYLIGTSLGKIYMNHFQPFQSVHQFVCHSAPITCLYIKGEKMVSCCKSHTMCIWDLNLEKQMISTEEEKAINRNNKRKSLPILSHRKNNSKDFLSNKPAQVIQFFFGSIRKIMRVEGIRDDKPMESTDLIIGQRKDFAVILVSLSLGELLGFFPPISGYAKEAFLLCNMNYLYVIPESEELFVFNIDCNAQERVIPENDMNLYTRRPARSRIRTETFDEVVEETSARQKVIMYNLRQFFPSHTQSALKVSTTFIGNIPVSVLTINIQQILRKLKKLSGPSRQLEYILSLLTCWVIGCKSHESILENIKDLLSLSYPAIKANIGLIGVDNAISFTLPSNKSYFEISSYVSALIMSSGYSLIEGLSQFLTNSLKKNSRVVTGHLISSSHSSPPFEVPFLTVLAVQSFFGIFSARFILQDNIVFIDLKSKHKFLECLFSLLEEQKTFKKTEKYVPLIEALCCTLLSYSMIELKMLKKEVIHQILTTLRKMLKSDNEGFYITAAGILGKGMEMWRQELSSSQFKEIVEELVLYGCKETQQHKQVFFRALISIASCNFIDFIEILAQEIENMDIDPLYPSSCIEVLDLFVEQRYEEVAAYLPAVIELIVRTLNPHNPMLRKTTIEKASHTLKTLILKLPMISFSQKQQRLAIGTMNHLVVVYDLKTASQWKLLKSHSGPVCAVQFDVSGDFLASYSSVDCSVLVWKLKSGFIQDLIGSSATKPVKVHRLACLDWNQANYKKFLDTVRLSWNSDNKIFLVREDSNKLIIQS
jgi:WD40 repeat protein